ncbi:aminopeptidase [Natronincola ferrireducens]|uniref:Aminopeptidase n=1 Tax=Natronincola ferrireducens TaxID=393762 RepID=A0A1G9FWE0_9FIRM|nr:aminopeptidase [Natronincola ferrireducens]SDK92710.1 aminopeptidase [Natronincola ferrireducens]
MNDFNNKLQKYAEVALKVGLNIQQGQNLVINAPIPATDFVRVVAKKAYELGVKNVHVEWADEEMTLIKLLHAPQEALKEFPMWKAKGYEEMAKEGTAFLSISAANPDLLKEAHPDRVATMNKTSATAMENFKRYIQNASVNWNIVSVPTKEWAKKVFPHHDEKESVEKLWENIFKVTRIDQPDPVKAWQDHLQQLKIRLDLLNNKKFKKLHFKAPGTDLTMALPEGHIWVGGGLKTEKGFEFVPNMPTEEVFSMPLKEGVDGVVSSTKPLNYGGNLIEDFTLTFKKGRIIDFTAEKGYETLKKLIETDEGAHYLGEVALVPHRSPVSDTDVIFFNTLFDENASNHFALGSAYPICIEEGTKMSKDELQKNGVNTSLVHVDFMIGSAEMDIDGETPDGRMEPIFRKGNWYNIED